MEACELPFTPKQWKHVMKSDGIPVLIMSIRRPVFPDTGKTKRLEHYFNEMAQQWKAHWETDLFPKALQALNASKETGNTFIPWKAELDYTITFWRTPLLSLRIDAVETGQTSRPLHIYVGETWDCSCGYPRTLRSFFPAKAHFWRRDLIKTLKAQAIDRLNSGESLLDSDCAQVMERMFDPDRFYLTEEGAAIFYPLYILGPYAEGIPIFTVALPEF